MENRFLEMDEYMKTYSPRKSRDHMLKEKNGKADEVFDNYGISRSQSIEWSASLSAQQRTLVILIENGGVDLGIPEMVNQMIALLNIPLVTDGMKKQLVDYLRKKITEFTDNLIETVELTANRYTASKPKLFGDVIILRNGNASFQQLKDTLVKLSKDKKIIDLFILTHGSDNYISVVAGGIDSQKIAEIKTANGGPLSIRSVYMMNCVGSSLNKAWLDAGAKVSSGAIHNNYLPEPTMYFFWNNWKEGQSFENAVTGAYRKTVNLMNDTVKTVMTTIPGLGSFASLIKFENFQFVKDSAPVIQGQRSLMINSDELNFSQSFYNSLATTVLPVSMLQSMRMSESLSDEKPKPWKWTQGALDLIKKFEGFRAKKYDDATGNCTIGYGTLLHMGKCNGAESEKPYEKGISEEDGVKLIMDKVTGFQKTINDNVTVDLNQNQFDSLLSFVYNIGSDAFKGSTLLKVLNQKKYADVPAEMKKWTKGKVDGKMVDLPGLVTRRNGEAALFTAAIATAKSMEYSAQQTILNTADLGNLISDAMPVRVLTLTQARDILQTLHGNPSSGIVLDAPPFNGSLRVPSQRKWVQKVAGQPDVQKDETHDVPRTYTVKPAKINGIEFKYMDTATSGKLQGNMNNLDPRMVVFLYKFTRWLKATWGVETIYHMGIGHGSGAQFDCHNTGRALDLGGLKGTYNGKAYELFVLRDWGSKPAKMNAGKIFYRLAAADGLAYQLFKDVYRYMVTQMSDTMHFYEPAKAGADLDNRMIQDTVTIPSNFIIHPDHPDATLRSHHNNHYHVQVGNTSYEANPPV